MRRAGVGRQSEAVEARSRKPDAGRRSIAAKRLIHKRERRVRSCDRPGDAIPAWQPPALRHCLSAARWRKWLRWAPMSPPGGGSRAATAIPCRTYRFTSASRQPARTAAQAPPGPGERGGPPSGGRCRDPGGGGDAEAGRAQARHRWRVPAPLLSQLLFRPARRHRARLGAGGRTGYSRYAPPRRAAGGAHPQPVAVDEADPRG